MLIFSSQLSPSQSVDQLLDQAPSLFTAVHPWGYHSKRSFDGGSHSSSQLKVLVDHAERCHCMYRLPPPIQLEARLTLEVERLELD